MSIFTYLPNLVMLDLARARCTGAGLGAGPGGAARTGCLGGSGAERGTIRL